MGTQVGLIPFSGVAPVLCGWSTIFDKKGLTLCYNSNVSPVSEMGYFFDERVRSMS